MQTMNLEALLRGNSYPGRGIVLGVDETGRNAVIVYFIMGRSENSRNRVFEETDDGIITRAFDESKMVDPHLIIYAPVRDLGDGRVIVTNGDQTDTVRDFLLAGKSFEDALRTRTFEDDLPNCTPRISGLVTVKDGEAQYRLSILKSDANDDTSVQRFFFDYPQPKAGVGHFVHTYQGNGSPLPSFEGEPEKVTVEGDIEQLALRVWDALDQDNKVSLYVSFISLESGEADTIIINKHDQEEC
ncbi:MAG: IMP cyclohydrolase [bacterium]|nr:IMP cyclohydrolase [bacterium]